ncbi:LysR family transcriptional regulator [Ligilactobacillus equi]
MNISLIKLKYFCDVIDLGGFSKAAESNLIAQTSVSQQIKELEEYYQCKLIDRSSRPVKATDAGRILYEKSKQVLADFAELEHSMASFLSTEDDLKIEYASLLDVMSLNAALQNSSYKNYTLHKRPLGQIASELKAGKYDFAVAFDSEFIDESIFDYYVINRGEYYLGVSLDHPLANQKEIQLEELSNHPLVMLDRKILGKSYEIMGKRAQGNLKFSRFVDDVDSEIFFIKQQKLAGFFPKEYEVSLKNDGVKLLKIKDSPHKYQVVIAWDKSKMTPKKQKFLENINIG